MKERGEEESVKWESELESLKAEQNHQRERFDRMEKKIDALLRHSKVKWEETSKLKEDTRFWSPSENRKQEQSELFDTRKPLILSWMSKSNIVEELCSLARGSKIHE